MILNIALSVTPQFRLCKKIAFFLRNTIIICTGTLQGVDYKEHSSLFSGAFRSPTSVQHVNNYAL